MFGVFVEDFVVDFIGEDDQSVFFGDGDDFAQDFFAIDRAGGVVRVDEDDAFGVGADFGADVFDRRVPAVFFVAEVVHRFAAGEVDGGGPQRVVRHRQQDFVAAVQECLHRHHDEFGDAVAEDDVINGHALDAEALGFVHDGFARGKDTFGFAVALRLGEVGDEVFAHFVRRVKAERCRVADVEFDDVVALTFHAHRFRQHRAANVVADVVQLVRFADFAHGVLRWNGRNEGGNIRSSGAFGNVVLRRLAGVYIHLSVHRDIYFFAGMQARKNTP